jgi:hypothetical protein
MLPMLDLELLLLLLLRVLWVLEVAHHTIHASWPGLGLAP